MKLKALVLSSRQTVIARVRSSNENTYAIQDALEAIAHPDGMMLLNFAWLNTNKATNILINRSLVIAEYEPDEEIIRNYEDALASVEDKPTYGDNVFSIN